MFLEKSLARVQFSLGLFFLLMMFLVAEAAGQGMASISGVIKDQNEAVVPGVLVIAGNKGSGAETITTTDTNGKYDTRPIYLCI